MRIKWLPKYVESNENIDKNLLLGLYVHRDDFKIYESVPQNSISQWCYEHKDIFKEDKTFQFICELVDSKDLDNYIIAFELITNIPDGNNS